jgi:N-acetylneuraminate synthase
MRYVAEVGSNHNGSLLRAIKLIDAAADAGFEAVKFQQFKIGELFRPEALLANPALIERTHLELDLEWHEQLAGHARARKLEYGVTPFYAECIPYLAELVDFFKVSSYQLLERDILRLMAMEQLPMVVSTGMATMKEVQEAIACIRSYYTNPSPITLLHCVSCYPAPTQAANLSAIETLRNEFKLPIGWSDHTVSPTVVRAAIWRWDAEMVELHFDLDDGRGAESKHSWTPTLFQHVKGWMADLPSSSLGQFDGHGVKTPAICEMSERKWRSDPTDGLRPIKGTL